MPDLLDRLADLDPETIDTDAGWTTVRRRVRRGAVARRTASGLAAITLVAAGLLVASRGDGDDATQVATQPEQAPSAIELEEGWNELPEMPLEPRLAPAIAELDDGDLFVWGGLPPDAGGAPLADGAVLDAETGEWKVLPAAPDLDLALDEPRAVWTGEQVVLFGSGGTPVTGPTTAPTPLRWDPSDSQWSQAADGPAGCKTHSLAWTGSEVVMECEGPVFAAYDPAADTWRNLPNPPVAYADTDLAWTGDRLVAFGRTEPAGLPAGDGTAVVYDPESDSWGQSFPVPVNAQATSIAWTGEEIVAVNYDMAAAAFDPLTGESRELPPVPLRFYECSPEAVTAGPTTIVNLCSGSAALAPDDRWAPFLGPNPEESLSFSGSESSLGGVDGQDAMYTTFYGLETVPGANELAAEQTSNLWAYRPPAVDANGRIPIIDRIPLGISTFSAPAGAEIVDVSLPVDRAVEARVVLEDGSGCTARSAYGPSDPDGVADGEEQVEITTADGWTGEAAVGRATPGAVTLAWYWNVDLSTDRQEATCPTLEQAIELAAGFDSPA